MKKAITICLLAVALLAGGITMDAKTTKKSTKKTTATKKSTTSSGSKPSSGLTFDTFCESFSQAGMDVNDWGISRSQAAKVYVVKDEDEIDSALQRLGFTRSFRNVKSEYHESVGEYEDCIYALYTKDTTAGTTIVRENCGSFSIEFPSAAEKNLFLKTAQTKGYRNDKSSERYLVPGTDDIYWIATFIYENGNQVSFSPGGE